MMKKFLLIVCGSFVGVWLALIIFTIVSVIASFAIFGTMSVMASSSEKVEKNSILHLDLSGSIEERSGLDDIDVLGYLRGNVPEVMSLETIVKAINEAATNDNIKGIYIECNGSQSGMASRFEIRKALLGFKDSGKFIYAYGDAISQGDYILASVADSIFVNPYGEVDIHGLAAVTPYFKKLLDKVGVEMQIIRVGTFKSAVEPYMLDSISPANRLQQEHYLGNIWNTVVEDITKSRKITSEQFNSLADNLSGLMPTDSLVVNKLVDATCYRNEFEDRLRALTDVDEDDGLNLVSVDALASVSSDKREGDKVVALVYAVGEIDGSSTGGIQSDELVETIRELQKDKDVSGLVLRVNSPGGSAFGSELIWKALDDFKKAGKTFAVSMGDYAASGGYYISSGADRIFASKQTITGSIGIFGMIPNVNPLVEGKLGVVPSSVKTNKNADFGTIIKPLTPYQKNALQGMVNRGYDLFTSRCADGRKVSQDSIKQIAEGRVWDGISALELGLVDEFGDIDAAIEWVAKKEKITDNYRVVSYPKLTSKWERIISKYAQSKSDEHLRGDLGALYDLYYEASKLLRRSHVLCLMEPVEIR